jgi:thioredoxin reductase (NADPH)
MNIKVYGTDWCSDCISTKKFLDGKGVDYEYIDITDNEEAIAFVEQINKGRRVIPTLIVDGASHTNPGIAGLMKIIV